ncbi:YybH family protein [Bauldia sp.]|uniref:YybH family protein n=1 Tax=Bauldia sp. TaxID=2575872 RepID=UPI003BA98322
MDDKEAVLKADDAFFAALNAMFDGDLDSMTSLWSHADDVVYLGPDKVFLVGWPAVLADWQRQAALKLGGQIKTVQRHATIGQDVSVVHCTAKGTNTGPDGNSVDVSMRGTNVFRREGGAWKLIAHHSDPLPFLG